MLITRQPNKSAFASALADSIRNKVNDSRPMEYDFNRSSAYNMEVKKNRREAVFNRMRLLDMTKEEGKLCRKRKRTVTTKQNQVPVRDPLGDLRKTTKKHFERENKKPVNASAGKGCKCNLHTELEVCIYCPSVGCKQCTWYNYQERKSFPESFIVQ